jgi:hypothetical protein
LGFGFPGHAVCEPVFDTPPLPAGPAAPPEFVA